MIFKKFPKSSRLLKKEDFLGLRRDAAKIYGNVLWAYAKERKEGEGSRIGISISKKVGNAVRRNFLKRIIRETFRLSFHDLGAWDILIVVNPKLFERVSNRREASQSMRKSLISTFLKIQDPAVSHA